MDNTNTNPDRIPELDSETANQLLNNIFAECEVVMLFLLRRLSHGAIIKRQSFVLAESSHMLYSLFSSCCRFSSSGLPSLHRGQM